MDGAFCEYSAKDKDRYMMRLRDAGVTNIEMESTAFTALTHKAGFKSAVVCVTLLDRINEDQVLFNPSNVLNLILIIHYRLIKFKTFHV